MNLAIISLDYSGLSAGIALAAWIVLLMTFCFATFALAWFCIWQRWFTRGVRGLLLCSQISSLLLMPAAVLFSCMIIRETFWEHELHRQHHFWMILFYGFVFPFLLVFIARTSFIRRRHILLASASTL